MSLITVEGLSLQFGGRVLFDDVGFALSADDRVGLVGRNGMGKTSLLRAIMHELQPDAGNFRIARGVRIGYLPQEVAAPSDKQLLASVLDSVPGRAQVERELASVESELGASSDAQEQHDLAVRLGELAQLRDHYETCYAQHEAERILTGLGFTTAQFEKPLWQLSGGWRMRAALASILFQQPDVLLLDEPTNHLDLPSVRWFDGYLKRYPGAFMLVSHDREFLNRQIERVISLELEGMRTYTGNYDHYVEQREEEDEVLQNRAKNIEREKKEIERFVERFKAKATHARQASSKAKMLRKLESVQSLELPKELTFKFKDAAPSGRLVVHLAGIAKRFGDDELYRDVDLCLYRGERVAVVGPNGAGKTTLLRIVANELTADAGVIELGHQVVPGYYAQHCADNLHGSLNIMQTLWETIPEQSVTYVRTVLGTFLFSGDDALKPVNVLSGGERARVALARLVVNPTNLLLLDEPTSHLDLNASEALAEALAQYAGAVLFVSHNLSLLKRLATKVWEVRDGQVREYVAGFDYYLEQREREQAAPVVDEKNAATARNRDDVKAKKRAEAEYRQVLARKLGGIPKKIAEIEARIAELEAQQQQLEQVLARSETYLDQTRYQDLLRDYNAAKSKVEELMARWEGLEEQRQQITAAVEREFDAGT